MNSRSAHWSRPALWITWETQRRSQTLSERFGAEYLCFDRPKTRLLGYCVKSAKTLWALLRKRPAIVFAQSPSIVLAVLVGIVGRVFRIPVVLDVHNAGLEPLESRSALLNAIAGVGIRLASVCIVTNEALSAKVRERGGRALVLLDPLPPLSADRAATPRKLVTCICSWGADEPIAAVLESARFLPGEVTLALTGRPRGVDTQSLPANVALLGFLDDCAYVEQLARSDALIVLTTRENCLVCGAYESISLGRPLILSDTAALRATFPRGTVFVRNDAREIARGIQAALDRNETLETEITAFKTEFETRWRQQFKQALAEIDSVASTA